MRNRQRKDDRRGPSANPHDLSISGFVSISFVSQSTKASLYDVCPCLCFQGRQQQLGSGGKSSDWEGKEEFIGATERVEQIEETMLVEIRGPERRDAVS